MKKFIVIAVLLAAMAVSAFAQAGEITDYMFGLPGGNFMETQWYVYSGFEKFYVQTGFDDAEKAKLGFATKTSGGLYIGVSYEGGLFKQVDVGYTESSIPVAPIPMQSSNFEGKVIKAYDKPMLGDTFTWNVDKWDIKNDRPNHSIGVLIGVADMGFKVSVDTDYQLFELTEDAIVGTDDYKTYKAEYGTISPKLKWGMAKNLLEKGIRPSVEVSFGFHTNSIQSEEYEPVSTGGLVTSYKTYGVRIGGFDRPSTNASHTTFNQGTDNYTDFGLAINLGGFTILSKDEFSFSVDFDYALSTRTYGENQFTWNYIPTTGPFEIKTFKEEGRFVDTNSFDTKITSMGHKIEPILQVQWDSEKIGVGAKLHLPVEITTYESTNNYIDIITDPSTYALKAGGTTKETTVSFSPVLKLGGSYRLVPEKFNINIGAKIGLSTAEESRVEETPNAGKTSTKVTPKTTGTTTAFSVGASLFLTKNVILDAKTGVIDQNEIFFFGTAQGAKSLTNFTSLLLMISY